MAKGKDPFETFKQATLSGPSLSDAIRVEAAPAAQHEEATHEPSPVSDSALTLAPASASEPAQAQAHAHAVPGEATAKVADDKAVRRTNSEQVSFFLEKDLKKKINLLKVETEKQLQDLYSEAIVDLLKKYGML